MGRNAIKDDKIISALRGNTLSMVDLSEKCSVTTRTLRSRVKRLIAEGKIKTCVNLMDMRVVLYSVVDP